MLMAEDLRITINEAACVDLSRPAVAARLPATPEAPILICVLKNELRLLDDFFRHYRNLGIERFVMIDNGSMDGTAEHCARQPDVELHIVRRPFKWQAKQGWISRAIAEHGLDRWYLYVDTDELAVFDGSEHHSLVDLCQMADAAGIRRVRSMMIDMYADGPLLDLEWGKGQPLMEAFCWFDSDSYVERKFDLIISRKGGPRKRTMANGDPNFNPEMSKYSLFRPRHGDLMVNPHHIIPAAENFVSPCYIGLLHYKFLPSFISKVRRSVNEKTYWNDSYEYRTYLHALTDNPKLSFRYNGTRRFVSSVDLVDANLIEAVMFEKTPSTILRAERRQARRRALERLSAHVPN